MAAYSADFWRLSTEDNVFLFFIIQGIFSPAGAGEKIRAQPSQRLAWIK